MDILVSGAALIVLSPVLVVIAVAVAIDSPGPPFYLGLRIGKNEKTFKMWKFRSMFRGAGRMGSITARNDRRVTRVGRFLRKTKLDELPQFFNVLLGDMTLVGPRPEAPEMVARYSPDQRALLSVKPGITGPVQLENVREEDSIPEARGAEAYYIDHLLDDKLRRDLEYLNSRTPLVDARVFFATAGVVLRSAMRR